MRHKDFNLYYPHSKDILQAHTIDNVGDGKVYIKTYKMTNEQIEQLGEVLEILEKRANETSNGAPISYELSRHFIDYIDRLSPEWEAVHNATSFWRYIALLVEKGFLDETIAFEAFSSPKILGFLFPIENSFVGIDKSKHKTWWQKLSHQIIKRKRQDYTLEGLYRKWISYGRSFTQ